MMGALRSRGGKIRALVLLPLLCVLLVLSYGAYSYRNTWLARHWQAQLRSAEPEELEPRLQAIAQLEADGMPVLVDSLASPDEETCRAAARVLTRHVAAWSLSPEDAPPASCLALVHALEDQLASLSPRARATAHRLVTRLLWNASLVGEDDDRLELIVVCEQVFRATAADAQEHGAWFEEQVDEHDLAATVSDTESIDASTTSVNAPDATEDVRASGSDPIIEPADGKLPRLGANNRVAAPLPSGEAPERQISAAKVASPWLPEEQERPTSPAARSAEMAGQSVEQLLFLMRRSDSSAAAEAELARRGFNAAWLQRARWLNHPDPRTRRERLADLTSLPGSDPRSWLLWLTEDPDAGVRLAAMSRLLTTGDPLLVRRVAQRARTDDDPQIRALAEKAERTARAFEPTTGRTRRR